MKRAHFRFYAELNDFLPPARRGVAFPHEFHGGPSVKDVIESLGVPHTEIDLILADGESVELSWILRDGARVSVYPVFESIDITPIARVRPAPLREVRFVLDVHLGRLARYLRMLGFDTRWRNDARDEDLASIAAAEHRTLLTRDSGLLKRRIVSHGYRVREVDPQRQLAEVVRRLDLFRSILPFRRCLCCNELLETVRKEDVADHLPPRVRERHVAFRRCPSCRRLYWAGSHRRRMERLISDLLAERARLAPAAGSSAAGEGRALGDVDTRLDKEHEAVGPGTPAMDLKVDCHAGYRGEETPRRFELDGRRVEVVEVIDRWLGPDHRYFKVRGDDGAVYLLRVDDRADRWELETVERGGA